MGEDGVERGGRAGKPRLSTGGLREGAHGCDDAHSLLLRLHPWSAHGGTLSVIDNLFDKTSECEDEM